MWSLPCAADSTHGKTKAHGKQIVCRVHLTTTHGKQAARQIDYFAVYLLMKPTVNSKHTANVLKSVTGKCFTVCPAGTLGKQHLLPCVFQFCRESRPMHTAKYWSKS